MSLGIRTFDNKSRSGDPLFKALGHPAIAHKVLRWIDQAKSLGALAVVDPWGQFSCLAALYDLSGLSIVGRFVQRVEDLSGNINDTWPVLSLLDLPHTNASAVLLAAFDDGHARRAISGLIPKDMPVISFDELRLDDAFITNKRRYLDPINFATNFSLFRAGNGRHSIVRTAEYWSGYGAKAPALWLTLLDGNGDQLAQWVEPLQPGQSIVLDAAEIKERFKLPAFSGMLLIHAFGIVGHDQVKYVLDDVDDAGLDPAVTHDSNSWPAQYYCGLPAPRPGDSVRLWLQNAHPNPIPAGTIEIQPIGTTQTLTLQEEIPAFGTYALKIEDLFPQTSWPVQFEVMTGQHVVRPRYEIVSAKGSVTFAHMNVERTDLQPDPAIAKAAAFIGKGYLLPAPILPLGEWQNIALPTPAATGQARLPLALSVYHESGELVLEKSLGVFERAAMPELNINQLLAAAGINDPDFAGHLELMYDFTSGIDVDGWLHGLFRYESVTGQMGETSFGAHVFNIPLTFRDEPQSYAGRPPGLSSRLFARLMATPLDAFVHLTYPSSGRWHSQSDTVITLHGSAGEKVAETSLQIPINGSTLARASHLFSQAVLDQAGPKGYMMVTDRTCRLFGYHGVMGPDGQFNLDHMFGF